MGYNREDFVRIKAEFSQKYIKARERASERRTELHEKFYRVWEIDRILSHTGMDIMGIIASGKNTDEQVSAIKERNEKLLVERGQILKDGGYPENYSDIQYECDKCGDTGYVDTAMCECMKRALVMAGYQSSGIGSLIESQSFDNFSLDYYKDTANADRFEATYRSIKDFSERFSADTYRNFLFIGGTGLGKTHLSTAVAKNVIDRGFDVLYVTMAEMIADHEAARFGDKGRVKHNVDRYTEADLLIIDDLGAELVNQFTVSCLYDVVNGRMMLKKSTLISTNLSPKEIEAKYNERIYSRLFGEYYPVSFTGTDIRRRLILRK